MPPIITSAHNPTVKQLKKLVTSAKTRKETNTYIAEGTHLTHSYLASGQTPSCFVVAESAMKNPEVAELTTTLLSRDIQCDMLSDTLFESFSSIHASVGIILLFHTTQPEIADITLTSSCIVLEDVQDPGNLGTILRTATAAGIKSAILSPQCASAWSPKALRAGMGAQFGITIYEDVDVLQFVTDSPLPTLVTTLSSRSTPLYETDLKKPVAWILGNEGQGVSEALTNAATTHISIPQADTPVESLNVAAAAAICLYEQYRQLHATD